MGYALQFTDTPNPNNFIQGLKYNINKQTVYNVTIHHNAKYLAVNIFGDASSSRLRSANNYATKKELDKYATKEELSSYVTKEELEHESTKKTLCCIGDSITQGSGASEYGKNFYWKLRTKLINMGIIKSSWNLGSGGSTSGSIATYCGGIGLYITEGVTIPSDGDIVIKLNRTVHNAANSVSYCNPCYLSGVKGVLSRTNNNYVFTRAESGAEKKVASGTTLVTNAGIQCINAELMTIFVGTNDGGNKKDDSAIDKLVYNTVQISKLSKNGKYIVLLPYKNSTSDAYRNKMLDTFGQKAIDLYKYFSEQAVYDAITKGLLSEGDQSNWIALLTSDGVHPNDIGHQLIAEIVYERMEELGYCSLAQ